MTKQFCKWSWKRPLHPDSSYVHFKKDMPQREQGTPKRRKTARETPRRRSDSSVWNSGAVWSGWILAHVKLLRTEVQPRKFGNGNRNCGMICFATQIDEDHHLKQLNSGLPKKKGCCTVLKLENHSFQKVLGLIINFFANKIDFSQKRKENVTWMMMTV